MVKHLAISETVKRRLERLSLLGMDFFFDNKKRKVTFFIY